MLKRNILDLIAIILGAIALVYMGMSGGTVTNHFDVMMTVHEDGLLDVEEQFDYDFTEDGHYDDYLLPAILTTVDTPWGKHQMTLLNDIQISMDGKALGYQQSSSDVLGETFNLGHNDGTLILGRHHFTMRYHLFPGLFISGNEMGMRWNVGGWWVHAAVAKSSITIHFPKTFTHNQVKSILFGEHGDNASEHWSDQNTYHASIENLSSQDSWGLSLSFPRDHLKLVKPQAFLPVEKPVKTEKDATESPHDNKSIASTINHPKKPGIAKNESMGTIVWAVFLALLPWLILCIAARYMYSLWSRGRIPYLKNIKVSYTPPEGVDAAQAGLLIDHSVDAKDISGILIELEQDGYICSEEDEYIRLLKEPDDDLPAYKQLLLKKLFTKGPLIFLGSDLSVERKLEIQHALSSTEEALYEWSVQQGFLRKNARKERFKVELKMIMMVPVEILALVYTAFLMNEVNPGIFIFSICLFAIQLLGITMFKKDASWGNMIGGGIVFLLPTIFQYFWLNHQIPSVYGIPGFVQSAFLPTVLLLLAHIRLQSDLPLRTAKGSKAYIQLLGYREFLQRVEKGVLDNDDKEASKALGFAIALGVKEHWFNHLQFHLCITEEDKKEARKKYAASHRYSL